MRKMIGKRLLASLLAMLLIASLCFASLAETEPEVRELTLEDLQAMNDGDLAYTVNDEGYITFLRGKYYDGVIEDGDDVIRALEGIGRLLGADEETGYVKGNYITDEQAYSYYTLYQWQGDTPVDFAIVKVIVDPNGQSVALSSSLMSGIPAGTENAISPQEALAVVKAHLAAGEPDTDYVYYENDVTKTRTQRKDADGGYTLTLVYVVYTNNPNLTLEDNGLAYLAHYVSASGEYLYSLPVASIGNEYAMQGYDTARTFEGKTAATYSGTVVGKSGATHEITVPVMLDENTGTYYLCDIQRKIAMADYWEYTYNDENVALLSSQDNADWDTDALLAYENYILTYDFYNAIGWQSCDGFGTPILLLTHYVDYNRNPIKNACYQGKNQGWQTFAATSDAMNAAEALDVIGHEYAHGMTTASVTQILYENQYGAINESLSDIMGNLVEMLSRRTDDTEWLIGETGGQVARSMSDPHAKGQPEYIGDIYFAPNAAIPSGANDRGGVHVNNTLLAGVAPKLYEAGMTLEEERLLWTTFILALTPRTGYAEANLMLPFAADVAGLGQHREIILKALDEIGMNNTDPFAAPGDDHGMVTMSLPDTQDVGSVRLVLLDEAGRRCPGYPMAGTSEIKMNLPAGAYKARVSLFDLETRTQEVVTYYFDGEGWMTDEETWAAVELHNGETLALPWDGVVMPDAEN